MSHRRWMSESDSLLVITVEEDAFLTKYGISHYEVFDATGLTRAQYKVKMKEGGYRVAVGVTVCPHGHALRNRHGGCVVCRPAVLAFAQRHHQEGHVYLAHSKRGRLYKVGSSNDLNDRFEQLNIHRYGGYDDWQIVETARCERAGQVEHQVHTLLADYGVDGSYGGRSEDCRELYRCTKVVALGAFRKVTGG